MRIVVWPQSPSAVVRVEIHGDVIVAISPHLTTIEVLDLARLVLSGGEFDEFRERVEDDDVLLERVVVGC